MRLQSEPESGHHGESEEIKGKKKGKEWKRRENEKKTEEEEKEKEKEKRREKRQIVLSTVILSRNLNQHIL